jgi:hypothetical protein
MERMFQPFFTTKPRPARAPVWGLAVAHGIMQGHQAGLRRRKAVRTKATAFRLDSPALETAGAEPSAACRRDPGLPGHGRDGQRAPPVDDEPVRSPNWAGATLETLGYRATAVTSARAALDLLGSGPSHVRSGHHR